MFLVVRDDTSGTRLATMLVNLLCLFIAAHLNFLQQNASNLVSRLTDNLKCWWAKHLVALVGVSFILPPKCIASNRLLQGRMIELGRNVGYTWKLIQGGEMSLLIKSSRVNGTIEHLCYFWMLSSNHIYSKNVHHFKPTYIRTSAFHRNKDVTKMNESMRPFKVDLKAQLQRIKRRNNSCDILKSKKWQSK